MFHPSSKNIIVNFFETTDSANEDVNLNRITFVGNEQMSMYYSKSPLFKNLKHTYTNYSSRWQSVTFGKLFP